MTGFSGSMTSVSFLRVSVEEQTQGEDDDLNELTSAANLFTQVPNLSDYIHSQRRTEEKKSTRRKVHRDPRVRRSPVTVIQFSLTYMENMCIAH